jgi:nucleoside-diphosphate kinase
VSVIERTIILLKPVAFQRLMVDRIIGIFVNDGFTVRALRFVAEPPRSLLEAHYRPEEFAALGKMEIRTRIISYCSSGPVMAVLLERRGAIDRARSIIGDRNPSRSAPGTIRSWVDDCFESADFRAEAMRDIVHGPRNKEEAERQIHLWFGACGSVV